MCAVKHATHSSASWTYPSLLVIFTPDPSIPYFAFLKLLHVLSAYVISCAHSSLSVFFNSFAMNRLSALFTCSNFVSIEVFCLRSCSTL